MKLIFFILFNLARCSVSYYVLIHLRIPRAVVLDIRLRNLKLFTGNIRYKPFTQPIMFQCFHHVFLKKLDHLRKTFEDEAETKSQHETIWGLYQQLESGEKFYKYKPKRQQVIDDDDDDSEEEEEDDDDDSEDDQSNEEAEEEQPHSQVPTRKRKVVEEEEEDDDDDWEGDEYDDDHSEGDESNVEQEEKQPHLQAEQSFDIQQEESEQESEQYYINYDLLYTDSFVDILTPPLPQQQQAEEAVTPQLTEQRQVEEVEQPLRILQQGSVREIQLPQELQADNQDEQMFDYEIPPPRRERQSAQPQSLQPPVVQQEEVLNEHDIPEMEEHIEEEQQVPQQRPHAQAEQQVEEVNQEEVDRYMR